MSATTTQQPRDDARLADQLAAARRAAADAERSAVHAAVRAGADVRPALAQAPNGGVVTSSDREGTQQTTISRDGKQTTISTDRNGVTRITGEDGKVTVIDPGRIAQEAAQAATSAVAATPAPMPPFAGDGGPPDSVIRLVGIVLTLLAIIIIGFPLSRAFARRIDRKATTPGPDPDLARRLDRIEQAIETMAEEVERVSEAQRYSAKLLTERLPETPARAIAGADQMMR